MERGREREQEGNISPDDGGDGGREGGGGGDGGRMAERQRAGGQAGTEND